jgi:hypothetical protein
VNVTTTLGTSEDVTYFAYGTLLDINGMRGICPNAEALGVLRLPDYRLGFATCGTDTSRGGCTLVETPGNIMYGVLYAMPPQELTDLDKAGGLPEGLWARLDITLLNEKGESVPASTYFIPNPAGPYKPPESYTRPILVGAKALSLPQEYIEQLEEIIRSA